MSAPLAMAQCIIDTEKDCIGLAKMEQLEKRVDEMRAETRRTHQEIFDRMRQLEDDRTEVKTHYAHIEDTLKSLKADIEEIKTRPNKHWDAVLIALIGGVVGFVLKSAGIF